MECAGCGRNGILLCETCIENTQRAPLPEHAFINAIFDYNNKTIKRAIWSLKYKNARGFAEIFAPYLYDEIIGALGNELFISGGENILLVPVPLHKKRHRERGYNQSELIAREILKLDIAHIFSYTPELLVRIKETKQQAKYEKRNMRIKNLRDAFHAPETLKARGKVVILLDDVTTTGATLVEAKRSIRHLRPRKVIAFAVAH
ncbi:MAG: hypothetical protein COV32_02570 [Candidatus Yonathbacteria bacterium CG10_big_fil_rev_8_21_14_0_10_43_136]|uniref:Phosphoribosyltransferase domain-containing protein n=2 Tax=Parcubacteria group TaxID=1794811 RepID=A0A2M7Q3U4_9BACT|nr:MAG: hypothetical protein AUK15_02090 [Candidatus Nomurabacteria bacterium CG2_30_43_9]PIQ35631.1 MAG: hypothetical protein COW60_02835 [Candidatus Yonathbacteria bacterium CG17_big_fil_post_rev_8_21_14_2_50_43_9]PIR40559.1 MAG: hypothetical protein COV32_02570 [Candidatus Yonathbacteria bacterium CG10_big_fil_rev_8_21_14_0_10_43_136]PIX56936.1 MAG: hypothetical protein COZ48_03310 [Candidatus Yonathbacteria bacterium CG_4_10_14_3_um_filter_43_12]PIY58073.1 MAG: hypothetical protein COY98_03